MISPLVEKSQDRDQPEKIQIYPKQKQFILGRFADIHQIAAFTKEVPLRVKRNGVYYHRPTFAILESIDAEDTELCLTGTYVEVGA
jgi:hypothetical protein